MGACLDLRPDEILLSLLVIRPNEKSRLTGISGDIHKTVYKLRNDDPEVFEQFVFTTNTPFPYSEQLASSLQSFQWTRLIGMENPDFRVFFVKPSAKRIYEKVVKPRLTKESYKRLEAASSKFWQELGVR